MAGAGGGWTGGIADMSYVLEALRRAEADRHRGQIPDLHAPPATPLSGGSAAAVQAPAAAWRWAGAGLVLALGAAAAVWWAMLPDAPRPANARAAEPAVASTAASAAVPVPATPPGQRPTASADADRRVDAPLSADAAPVPPPVALPATEPPRRAATRSTDVADEPPPGRTVPPNPPPLVFGGAFDSPDPRARMLIINGQVWREGDEPAPGWVLERIGLHVARFRHQGRSVELPYDGPARAVSRP